MQRDNHDPLVRAPVNRILRSSIVDGPGNRAVVFLQGCNYDCVYCHNPETISLCRSCGVCVKVCPAGALPAADNSGGLLAGGAACTIPGNTIPWEREKCVLCDACLKACPYNSSPRVRFMTPAEVMAELCKLYNVLEEETLAIGDNENDTPMLKAAGIGAAVANAVESTKRAADYICRESYSGGVVEAIRRFALTDECR